MFDGTLLGAVATSALELGVDIGGLDCTVLLGFPGSISSMWQQAGRSGRSGRDALTLMVLWNSPLEQYIAKHPAYLFDRSVEGIALDPENPIVLRSHALCAASESAIVLSSYSGHSSDVGGHGETGDVLSLQAVANRVHRVDAAACGGGAKVAAAAAPQSATTRGADGDAGDCDGAALHLDRTDDALFGQRLKSVVAELVKDKLLRSVVIDAYGNEGYGFPFSCHSLSRTIPPLVPSHLVPPRSRAIPVSNCVT